MHDQNYITNKHGVYADNFDGEVVIVNLNLGNYYNVRHVASSIWQSLEVGINVGDLITQLKKFYPLDSNTIEQDIHNFINNLTKDELILTLDVKPIKIPEFINLPSEYTPPQLEVFSDLQDLFLLDPVHAVDDKMGWPIQAKD